jgi:hypothetical protein
VIAGGTLAMREISDEFGFAKSAHNLAKSEGPPPLAVTAMLGLTRSPGQANADLENYDFSLNTANSSIYSGL